MTSYIQETDSKTVYALPREIHYSFTDQPLNETFGGALLVSYLPLPVESDLLRPSWELLYKLENKCIAREARRLLSVIQEAITIFQKFHFDLGHVPQLRPSITDDGAILFEWIFGDFRIGFSIEPNIQESGWFLITNRNLGEISACGFISGIDLNALIPWLINFILSHS
jgi:hypothetical protein